MKKYFILFLCILLYTSSFSQHNNNNENDAFNNEAIEEARKNWDTFLDYTIKHPEILINPNLQLESYEEVDTVDTDVMDFLTEPIDSLQVVPIFHIGEEMLNEMQKDNFEVQSSIKLIPFSDLSLAEQYRISGKKVYTITKAIDSDKKLKLIKLKWKYLNDYFNTLCLVTDNEIRYNLIISNLMSYEAERVRN